VGFLDFIMGRKGPRLGRPPDAPHRDTTKYPSLTQIGRINNTSGLVYKPSPRNLRFFSRTPHARRAINAIKNPIKMMEWEIVPIKDIDWNSELIRQADIVYNCFANPNEADDFQSLLEQLLEDRLIGAGAIETQIGGDKDRPLFMWPVDGLSIQIYAEWNGDRSTPRYAQTVGYGSGFGGGEVVRLRDDELLYLRPNPTTATPFGYGPLEIAFDTISRLLSVGKFAGNVAGNQRPSIGLDFPGMPTNDLMAIRSFWRNEVEGNGQIPMFASHMAADSKAPGMQVHRFYPEGDNGLYLKYQEMLQRELATAFDLSPQNFGIERDVNRDTAEVSQDRDWNQAIKPTAHDVAKGFTRHCIQNKLGFSQLCFRFKGLDREDELSTARIFELRYKGNSITPNEVRARFGEDPMEGEWADKTFADSQIALWAARGVGAVIDKDLAGEKKPAKKSQDKG
jgi:Phage portal protein